MSCVLNRFEKTLDRQITRNEREINRAPIYGEYSNEQGASEEQAPQGGSEMVQVKINGVLGTVPKDQLKAVLDDGGELVK